MMVYVAKTADVGLMTLCRAIAKQITASQHIRLFVQVTKNVLYLIDVKEEEKAIFVTAQKNRRQ